MLAAIPFTVSGDFVGRCKPDVEVLALDKLGDELAQPVGQLGRLGRSIASRPSWRDPLERFVLEVHHQVAIEELRQARVALAAG